MTGPRPVAKRAAALLILSTLWLAASHAAEPAAAKFTEEFVKQDKIYRGDEKKVTEGYTVDRTLTVYTNGLASGFDRALANLGPTDRWLDIGAGEGRAVLDYYTLAYDIDHPDGKERRGTKAQAIAMSIEDRRTPLWLRTAERLGENKIRYVHDKRLREYSVADLGKFQVITDVIGGFSYTDNLSRFMEKVLGFLELNGSFFTVLQDVNQENATNRPFYQGAPFLTEIRNADGSDMKVCSWLKRITCVEVTCESKAPWVPPTESFRVRKVCENVSVPALAPVHYQAGTPPERRFHFGELSRSSP